MIYSLCILRTKYFLAYGYRNLFHILKNYFTSCIFDLLETSRILEFVIICSLCKVLESLEKKNVFIYKSFQVPNIQVSVLKAQNLN